jgi:endoglucanase
MPARLAAWLRPSHSLLLAGLVLVGCTPTRTPPSVPTIAPTPTSVPTPTPQPTPTPLPYGTGPLSARGSKLIDAGGHEVRLTGVNWSGLETGTFAPIGLSTRSLESMLDQMIEAGFNTLRLPFSNQLLDPGSQANKINYSLNPALRGLTGLELLDGVIEAAGRRGLRVILDRHRLNADEQAELWYSARLPEARWIQDWIMLADHYRDNPTVIGADLTNEPHGAATWGDDNPRTDWRLAAERAGNAILAANSDWLIIVEGIQRVDGDGYWWGGNLAAAGRAPVRLSRPERLVYSAHDYGPDEYQQYWFQGPNWADNLPSVWRRNWAYLHEDDIAPVLVGEFGGRSIGQDAEGTWQRALIGFLHDGGFSHAYWVWNPDSWIGGLLLDDHGTLDHAKLNILTRGRSQLLGRPEPPQSEATPAAGQ